MQAMSTHGWGPEGKELPLACVTRGTTLHSLLWHSKQSRVLRLPLTASQPLGKSFHPRPRDLAREVGSEVTSTAGGGEGPAGPSTHLREAWRGCLVTQTPEPPSFLMSKQVELGTLSFCFLSDRTQGRPLTPAPFPPGLRLARRLPVPGRQPRPGRLAGGDPVLCQHT